MDRGRPCRRAKLFRSEQRRVWTRIEAIQFAQGGSRTVRKYVVVLRWSIGLDPPAACNGGCDEPVMEHDQSGLPRWALVVLALAAVLTGCRSVTLRPPEAAFSAGVERRRSSDRGYRLPARRDVRRPAACRPQPAGTGHCRRTRPPGPGPLGGFLLSCHVACGPSSASRRLSFGRGQAAWQVYHRGLAGIDRRGSAIWPLGPARTIDASRGIRRVIPINYYGFSWLPGDFDQLALAERFRSRDITNHHVTEGLGLALIAVRKLATDDQPYLRARQPFAVTAVLRPHRAEADRESRSTESGAVLDFYNPLAISAITWRGQRTSLCAI